MPSAPPILIAAFATAYPGKLKGVVETLGKKIGQFRSGFEFDALLIDSDTTQADRLSNIGRGGIQ